MPKDEPKIRLMPLTTALARFVDVADMIKSRVAADETLRDLCDDYHLSRRTLTKLKKERPRNLSRITEYRNFVEELEDEIIKHLLDSKEQYRK